MYDPIRASDEGRDLREGDDSPQQRDAGGDAGDHGDAACLGCAVGLECGDVRFGGGEPVGVASECFGVGFDRAVVFGDAYVHLVVGCGERFDFAVAAEE